MTFQANAPVWRWPGQRQTGAFACKSAIHARILKVLSDGSNFNNVLFLFWWGRKDPSNTAISEPSSAFRIWIKNKIYYPTTLKTQIDSSIWYIQHKKNCGFSVGSNHYWAGRVYDLCVYFMTGTPEGSTESGLEKPGNEHATPGLQDIGLSPTPRRFLHKWVNDLTAECKFANWYLRLSAIHIMKVYVKHYGFVT